MGPRRYFVPTMEARFPASEECARNVPDLVRASSRSSHQCAEADIEPGPASGKGTRSWSSWCVELWNITISHSGLVPSRQMGHDCDRRHHRRTHPAAIAYSYLIFNSSHLPPLTVAASPTAISLLKWTDISNGCSTAGREMIADVRHAVGGDRVVTRSGWDQ